MENITKTEILKLLKYGKCHKDKNIAKIQNNYVRKTEILLKYRKFYKDENLKLLKFGKCFEDGNIAKIRNILERRKSY